MLSVANYTDIGWVNNGQLFRLFPLLHDLQWSEVLDLAAPTRTAVPFTGTIVRVAALVPTYIEFGDAAVVTNANSIILPIGTVETFAVEVGQYLAAAEVV